MNINFESRENRIALLGAVMVLLVISYLGFIALDHWGLQEQHSSAVVLDKRHEAPQTQPVVHIVNHRPTTIRQHTPETYLLQIEIAGQRAQAQVSRELYESIATSQTVTATFKRGRVTGDVQIVDVSR